MKSHEVRSVRCTQTNLQVVMKALNISLFTIRRSYLVEAYCVLLFLSSAISGFRFIKSLLVVTSCTTLATNEWDQYQTFKLIHTDRSSQTIFIKFKYTLFIIDILTYP